MSAAHRCLIACPTVSGFRLYSATYEELPGAVWHAHRKFFELPERTLYVTLISEQENPVRAIGQSATIGGPDEPIFVLGVVWYTLAILRRDSVEVLVCRDPRGPQHADFRYPVIGSMSRAPFLFPDRKNGLAVIKLNENDLYSKDREACFSCSAHEAFLFGGELRFRCLLNRSIDETVAWQISPSGDELSNILGAAPQSGCTYAIHAGSGSSRSLMSLWTFEPAGELPASLISLVEEKQRKAA